MYKHSLIPKASHACLENPSISGWWHGKTRKMQISIITGTSDPPPTHTYTQWSPAHMNTGLRSLVSNYHDNWGVHHAAQRLVNIFSGYSINSFITKQQQKNPTPPISLLHTHTNTVPLNVMVLCLIWREFDRQHFNDQEPGWGLKLTVAIYRASIMSWRKTLNSQINIYGEWDGGVAIIIPLNPTAMNNQWM